MDYIDILKHINDGVLYSTFPLIREKASKIGRWDINEEVEELWETYQRMLTFTVSGIKDPKAEAMRKSICEKLSKSVVRMMRAERIVQRTDQKYVAATKTVSDSPSFKEIAETMERASIAEKIIVNDDLLNGAKREYALDKADVELENARRRLFMWTWTSEPWHSNDVHIANEIIFSNNISNGTKSMFVSAITLSLLEYPDKAKVLFLLDCYLIDDVQIAQRALVGFILAIANDEMYFYRNDEEIENRLMVYIEDAVFVKDLFATASNLQLSCTTDRITKTMQEDIMPFLSREILSRRKNKDDDKKDDNHGKSTNLEIDELTKHGENPEWHNNEMFESKLRQMSDMQLKGDDVNYSSFASMKGFSFFDEMMHWFYPFNIEEPMVPEQRKFSITSKMGKLVNIIFNTAPFCDSDKYSILFSMNSFGKFGEDMIEQQLAGSMIGEKDIEGLTESAEKVTTKRSDVCRNYIFDLYRFFHSYPYKVQFFNPYKWLKEHPLNPQSNSILRIFAKDDEKMMEYADFLMHREFYNDALSIYSNYTKNEFDNDLAAVWQKFGFCNQKIGNTKEAISAYKVANDLKPHSKWTLSHLAALCVEQKNYEDAATYYKNLLEINPESTKYLLNAGRTNILRGCYEEALSMFYKASFLDEDSEEIRNMINWCNLCSALMKDNVSKSFEIYKNENITLTEEKEEQLTTLANQGLLNPTSVNIFIDALKLNIE